MKHRLLILLKLKIQVKNLFVRKWFITVCLIVTTGYPTAGWAADLLEVFQQALFFDPTFKTAESQWLAAYQQIAIERGALLPNISATGIVKRIHEDITFLSRVRFWDTSQQYTIQANQPIFNYAAWARLQDAKAKAKQAFAAYNAAVQDLMMRVATAYFAVLQAHDQLLATTNTKKSLEKQLQKTDEQFKLGLITITGVLQVRSSYDQAVSQEVLNQNDIAQKLEDLRAITGVFYTELSGVKADFPLVIPNPLNINAWTLIATRQNYNIKAAYYATVAAQENIKIQRAGHYPTVAGSIQYLYDRESAQEFSLSPALVAPETQRLATFAIEANLPIYSGGTVTAQTRQASYQYAEASAKMQQIYLDTLRKTRQGFLGVMSGISELKANKAFISSSRASLNATKTSYTHGTATIVDMLQQQSGLYNAQNLYAEQQYRYILSSLLLKQSAGTLNARDLAEVNCWLGKNINFAAYDFNQHLIRYAADTLPIESARSRTYNNKQQSAFISQETPENYVSTISANPQNNQ